MSGLSLSFSKLFSSCVLRELSILMKNLSFTASLQDQSLWMIESMALLLNGTKFELARECFM